MYERTDCKGGCRVYGFPQRIVSGAGQYELADSGSLRGFKPVSIVIYQILPFGNYSEESRRKKIAVILSFQHKTKNSNCLGIDWIQLKVLVKILRVDRISTTGGWLA
jgi:hypothetical protein